MDIIGLISMQYIWHIKWTSDLLTSLTEAGDENGFNIVE